MRRLLSFIILSLSVLCFSACERSEEERAHILKVYNWADYIDPALLDEFEVWYEQQTGEKVEVVYQLFDINEIMLAKIERGEADYDLACPSEYIIERMLRNDLIVPIDKSIVPDSINYFDNVSPYIKDVFDKIDGYGKNANDYAVGYMWGTTGILYNKKYVQPEELSSWSALWAPKFKNRLLVKDAFRDVYSPLLMYENREGIANGTVSRDSLMYDASDASIAKVEKLMMKMKPNIAGWEADFGKEIMTKEKAWLNLTWSGDAVWAIKEAADVGVELDYTVPEEGSAVWFDGWVIPKYAKNKKAAVYFINFMCKPENAILNMEEIGYVSVIATPEILEYVEESAVEAGFTEPLDLSYFFEGADSVVANPVLYHDRKVIERCAMMHDSGERTEELLEMWSRVKGDNLSSGMVIFICSVFGILLTGYIIRRLRRYRLQKKRR